MKGKSLMHAHVRRWERSGWTFTGRWSLFANPVHKPILRWRWP